MLVLLIMIAASSLILTAAGVAMSEESVSSRTMQRNDALQAAEAGLDIAIGEFRSAVGVAAGNVEDLPCNTNTLTVNTVSAGGFQLTGYVGTGGATYNTTVTYWTGSQPTAYNISQGNSTPLLCYASTYPDDVPNYALLTSLGEDSATAPSRNVEEIYTFENDNLDMPGGLIGDFDWQGVPAQTSPPVAAAIPPDDLCIVAASGPTDDSGTTTATVGMSLYVNYCGGGTIDFTWQYTSNFQLELSNSGWCMQPNIAGGTVALQACLAPSSPSLYTQQWGIDDSGDYEPVLTTGGASGYCLAENSLTPTPGTKLVVTRTDVAGTTCDSMGPTMTWDPTPPVGDGDAGAGTTNQLVNYDEFGNCLDDTNQSLPPSYLIDYMCKQFPDGVAAGDTTDPTYNQRWYQVPVTYTDPLGTVHTNLSEYMLKTAGTYWCLWSPMNDTNGLLAGSANPSWANIEVCPVHVAGATMPTGAASENFLWSYMGTPSYWLQDFKGYCLTADTNDRQVPAGGSAFTTITVASCSSSNTAEEWNGVTFYKTPGPSDQFEPDVSGS